MIEKEPVKKLDITPVTIDEEPVVTHMDDSPRCPFSQAAAKPKSLL